jgi:tripartite-type tricarboxylate transporter receptor subunit TctC
MVQVTFVSSWERAMKFPRRRFLHLTTATAALGATRRLAWAQTYPTRPITMIVPFPAGGAADVIGRVVAETMGKSLGQPVIVENVTGADGSIGIGRAARARPDGYTICLGAVDTLVVTDPSVLLQYNALTDFAPISLVTRSPFVLYARRTIPARDLTELIAWLKANPNKVSAGVITLGFRLMTLLLQRETSTRFVLVPYRGGPPAIQDLAAEQIDILFCPPSFLPLARAGSIKAYAVTNDTRITPVAPDIPTFTEMGFPAVSFSVWKGLFAPKGTPRDIIDRLNREVIETLADPAVRSRLVETGEEIFPRERQTPEVLGELVKADAEKWWPIIKEFGIKAE